MSNIPYTVGLPTVCMLQQQEQPYDFHPRNLVAVRAGAAASVQDVATRGSGCNGVVARACCATRIDFRSAHFSARVSLTVTAIIQIRGRARANAAATAASVTVAKVAPIHQAARVSYDLGKCQQRVKRHLHTKGGEYPEVKMSVVGVARESWHT